MSDGYLSVVKHLLSSVVNLFVSDSASLESYIYMQLELKQYEGDHIKLALVGPMLLPNEGSQQPQEPGENFINSLFFLTLPPS